MRALVTAAAFLVVVVCGGGSGVVLVVTGDGVQVAVGVVAALVNVVTGMCLMFIGLDWAFTDRGRGRHG